MVWSRWVEDTIYSLYRRYDLKGCKEQQDRLKSLCVNELNSHEGIKEAIKDSGQMEYFIIQMALENLIVCEDEKMAEVKEMFEFERKQKEEMENCTKMLRSIVRSEDSHILGTRFAATFFKEAASDDETYDKIGFHAMQDIYNNNIGSLFISLCGWSLKSLMIKANLMKDVKLEYHDEVIEAVYVTKAEENDDIVHKHTCKINMKTFEVFDIECDAYEDGANEKDCLKDEWIEINGDIYPLYPQDESECLPYHVFWYGDDE